MHFHTGFKPAFPPQLAHNRTPGHTAAASAAPVLAADNQIKHLTLHPTGRRQHICSPLHCSCAGPALAADLSPKKLQQTLALHPSKQNNAPVLLGAIAAPVPPAASTLATACLQCYTPYPEGQSNVPGLVAPAALAIAACNELKCCLKH
jgi:hypothetical protein